PPKPQGNQTFRPMQSCLLQTPRQAPAKDSVASHKKFQEKYQLPFELLSDPEHKVIEQYDVWKEKSMYGKKYMGIVRSTYLIDEEGNIEKALEKVKPQQNPEQMLKLVEDL
ncbi:peroxiredoxin, partial [Dubosiella newyorkensis]|uniref:peroxiredoxin n=1 Tax=Dubosiella newyorkensis TaxID=1862672 RepID=UPI00272D2EF6